MQLLDSVGKCTCYWVHNLRNARVFEYITVKMTLFALCIDNCFVLDYSVVWTRSIKFKLIGTIYSIVIMKMAVKFSILSYTSLWLLLCSLESEAYVVLPKIVHGKLEHVKRELLSIVTSVVPYRKFETFGKIYILH